MNFFGSGYYKINKLLLLITGLWPYERSVLNYCQAIFCNIIMILTSVSQITKLVKSEHDINLMMQIFSPLVMCVASFLKYQTFCIITGKIRYLVDHIQKDWSMLKNEKELKIVQKYAYFGSMCTIVCTILGFGFVLICILTSIIPDILDVFMPLNTSRPRELLFPGYYFVDEKKYFYAISLLLNVTIILMMSILLGTETLFVMYVQHVCAMFRVASYRINQAFDKNFLQSCAPEKKTTIICKKIIEAVYIHKRTLEFCEFIWSSLVASYSILIIIGIMSLIINLFCLFQAVFIMKETNKIIRIILYILMEVIYFFLGNYVGQILIDHSISILDKIYFTQWYRAPWQIQKLLLFMMQRSAKSCKMIIGGIFTTSMEGFATVMSTTMSYFMVLWSVQK